MNEIKSLSFSLSFSFCVITIIDSKLRSCIRDVEIISWARIEIYP